MRFNYGDKTLLRVLDEAEFWKRQEAEHTVVIRVIVPNLEPVFVEQLKAWEQVFTQTDATIGKYIETIVRSGYCINPELYREILDLIRLTICQSQNFIALLNAISAESEAVRSNPTAPVVINHIRRESAYFIGVAQTVLYC
ncbi:MAG: hypothetical protein CVV03_11185 [Firmicutes bacterium HGW-Firmicutes-8]|nr:MAG: hypothetical protein CVV03_11185 [Firmicutes bacterium HGW-Firmicutes-8]